MTASIDAAEAVEVEAVEADLRARRRRPSLCARSQPTKSSTSALRHIQVGKRRKPRSASSASRSSSRAADVAVDAVGVRPVALDRDGGEALLADQALRDPGALAVELVRAVAGLAEQHDARVADQLEQRVVVAGVAGERVRLAPDRVEDRRARRAAGQRCGHGQLTGGREPRRRRAQVLAEPVGGEPADGVERARLLEQVAGARDDHELRAGSAAARRPAG